MSFRRYIFILFRSISREVLSNALLTNALLIPSQGTLPTHPVSDPTYERPAEGTVFSQQSCLFILLISTKLSLLKSKDGSKQTNKNGFTCNSSSNKIQTTSNIFLRVELCPTKDRLNS